MKKITILLCAIMAIPFMLCSCFEQNSIMEISLDKTEATMTVGDSMELTVSFTPENASVVPLDWESSDSKVASVSDGIVKAKNVGTTVVTVKTEYGNKKSCNITIVNKSITSIVLSNTDVSVKEGKKIQLTAKVQPSDAPSDGLLWSSNDEKIAVVNSDGYITGVTPGVTNIICTAPNGKTAACTVTVKATDATNPATEPTDSTEPSSQPSSSSSSASKNKINTQNSSPQEIGNTFKSDFIFYDSSYRRLNDSEVSALSSDELQRAINEIYARHGRKFKDSDIKAFFASKQWYIENPSFSDSDVNDVEAANISLLIKHR